MELDIPSFQTRLQQQLDPLYFISGEESFLIEVSVNSVHAQAKEQGFTEVTKVDIAQESDWSAVLADLGSRSLFAEKRVTEVRLQKNRFGKEFNDTIQQWLGTEDEDTLLIIRGLSWDYRDRRAKWFEFLAKHAVAVLTRQMPPAHMRDWVSQQALASGLRLTSGAIDELIMLTEGNLFAAHQEIERLSLAFLDVDRKVDIDDLTNMNWSISGSFEIIDEACRGSVKDLVKKLDSVKRDGIEPVMVNGAIAAQLRRLHKLKDSRSYPRSARERQLQTVANRLGRTRIEELLMECAHIDAMQKGILRGDPWNSIAMVLLGVAQRPDSSIESSVAFHRVDFET